MNANGEWKTAFSDACPETCKAGEVASSGYYGIGTQQNARPVILSCHNLCETVFDGTSPAGSATENGVKQYYAFGSYVKTGNSCGSNPPVGPVPKPSIPDNSCAQGQAAGEINGKFVCVDQAGNPASQPPQDKGNKTETTTTTQNPDGSTTTTTKKTETDEEGRTRTTTTTTRCTSPGNCTATTEVEGDEDFGDDEEGEKCDPDQDPECQPAAECTDEDREAGVLRCMQAGEAPGADDMGGIDIDVGAIRPTEGWQSDASCPADQVINTSLAGPVTISWSLFCTAADYARPAIIGIAWIVAVFTFMGLSRRD